MSFVFHILACCTVNVTERVLMAMTRRKVSKKSTARMATGKVLTTKLPSPMRMRPNCCCRKHTMKPSRSPATTATAQMRMPSARKARRTRVRVRPMLRRMKTSCRLLIISSESEATRLRVEMSTMSERMR